MAGHVGSRDLALIVEDQPDLAELEARVLATLKFRTAIAPDVDTALDAMAHEVPAVVILDLRLGSADGLNLLSALRRQYGPVPPVLVVSGFVSPEVSTYVGLFPNVDILPKSQISGLRSAIRALVGAAPDGTRDLNHSRRR